MYAFIVNINLTYTISSPVWITGTFIALWKGMNLEIMAIIKVIRNSHPNKSFSASKVACCCAVV